MSMVIAIIGVVLIAAWIEQELVLRRRKRRWTRLRNTMDKLCEDSDDGPEGDY